MRFAARLLGLASPSGPLGSLGSGAQGWARRSFYEAVRKDLGVPLTLEGPTWTVRGVPALRLRPFDRRTRRERDDLALLVWRGIGA